MGCPMCKETAATQGVKLADLEASVKELQDWQKWAVRLALGAVMLAVIYQVLPK
jgi:hypothetical protein